MFVFLVFFSISEVNQGTTQINQQVHQANKGTSQVNVWTNQVNQQMNQLASSNSTFFLRIKKSTTSLLNTVNSKLSYINIFSHKKHYSRSIPNASCNECEIAFNLVKSEINKTSNISAIVESALKSVNSGDIQVELLITRFGRFFARKAKREFEGNEICARLRYCKIDIELQNGSLYFERFNKHVRPLSSLSLQYFSNGTNYSGKYRHFSRRGFRYLPRIFQGQSDDEGKEEQRRTKMCFGCLRVVSKIEKAIDLQKSPEMIQSFVNEYLEKTPKCIQSQFSAAIKQHLPNIQQHLKDGKNMTEICSQLEFCQADFVSKIYGHLRDYSLPSENRKLPDILTK